MKPCSIACSPGEAVTPWFGRHLRRGLDRSPFALGCLVSFRRRRAVSSHVPFAHLFDAPGLTGLFGSGIVWQTGGHRSSHLTSQLRLVSTDMSKDGRRSLIHIVWEPEREAYQVQFEAEAGTSAICRRWSSTESMNRRRAPGVSLPRSWTTCGRSHWSTSTVRCSPGATSRRTCIQGALPSSSPCSPDHRDAERELNPDAEPASDVRSAGRVSVLTNLSGKADR